jgi:hypothetical protein
MNFPEIPTSLNDPIFQNLVRRKQQGEDTNLPPIQEFSQQDINELESFCRKYGIIGFNCGRMHPRAALRMLKMKMGVPNEEKPIVENRSLLKG